MTRTERVNDFRAHAIEHLPDLNTVFRLTNALSEMGFFDAPASTRFHGNYAGGLYDHCKEVYLQLEYLTDKLDLSWQKPRSTFVVGMLHDLCKCDQYEIDDEDMTIKYRTTLLTGHGDKSVMLLNKLPFMQFTDEEIVCIRYHMGAFTDQKEWSSYTEAIHAFPNVLWTHTADMTAAHILGI